jgi:hypothetical protein
MKEPHKDEPNPGMSPVRNSLKDRALTPGENRVESPEDSLETGDGKENLNDETGLNNDFEKSRQPTTPAAVYDGIRDGDRDANDEIYDAGRGNDGIYGDEVDNV